MVFIKNQFNIRNLYKKNRFLKFNLLKKFIKNI